MRHWCTGLNYKWPYKQLSMRPYFYNFHIIISEATCCSGKISTMLDVKQLKLPTHDAHLNGYNTAFTVLSVFSPSKWLGLIWFDVDVFLGTLLFLNDMPTPTWISLGELLWLVVQVAAHRLSFICMFWHTVDQDLRLLQFAVLFWGLPRPCCFIYALLGRQTQLQKGPLEMHKIIA